MSPPMFLLALFSSSTAVQLTDIMKEKLTNLIDAGFPCMDTAAFTIGVITLENPQNNFTYYKGKRNIEEDQLVTADTLFGIGSTTKAMTTIVANKVLMERNLTWDTPIKEFYDKLVFPDKQRTNTITFRDLFGHRTCMNRADSIWVSGPDSEHFSLDLLIEKIRFLEEMCEFGSEFHYNNLMYAIGGQIISLLADRSWKSLIQEHIFDALDMSLSQTTYEDSLELGNVLVGYLKHDGEFVRRNSETDADLIIDLVAPAGSVHSTAVDMIKYLRYLVQDPDNLFDNLFWENGFPMDKWFGVVEAKHIESLPISTESTNYTLSWVLNTYQGAEYLYHGGDTFTTSTFITLSRDAGYGIFCSSTGSTKARSANQLYSWYVQDLLAGREPWLNTSTICTFPEPWVSAEDSTYGVDESSVAANSSELAVYEGTYHHDFFGSLTIELLSEGLYFVYNRFNCILQRNGSVGSEFQCVGNAPHVPSDPEVKFDYRTIIVEFTEAGLLTNVMEQNEEYLFTRSSAEKLSPVVLLLVVILTHLLH